MLREGLLDDWFQIPNELCQKSLKRLLFGICTVERSVVEKNVTLSMLQRIANVTFLNLMPVSYVCILDCLMEQIVPHVCFFDMPHKNIIGHPPQWNTYSSALIRWQYEIQYYVLIWCAERHIFLHTVVIPSCHQSTYSVSSVSNF